MDSKALKERLSYLKTKREYEFYRSGEIFTFIQRYYDELKKMAIQRERR